MLHQAQTISDAEGNAQGTRRSAAHSCAPLASRERERVGHLGQVLGTWRCAVAGRAWSGGSGCSAVSGRHWGENAQHQSYNIIAQSVISLTKPDDALAYVEVVEIFERD